MSQAAVAFRVYDCPLDPWQDHVNPCQRWVLDAIAAEGASIQSLAVRNFEGQVIASSQAAALTAQQSCLASYIPASTTTPTGMQLRVTTRLSAGVVDESEEMTAAHLSARTAISFSQTSDCETYPRAMFVTDVKEAVAFYAPDSTIKYVVAPPHSGFALGNVMTGRAWEYARSPMSPSGGGSFRGIDGIVYAGISMNPTTPLTADNSVELDEVAFQPNRLAMVSPLYGLTEPDVHVPTALNVWRVVGNPGDIAVSIQPHTTQAQSIGSVTIKLEEISSGGSVSWTDVTATLWATGTQVFLKNDAGVAMPKFRHRAARSGTNTYRAILLTIAWSSAYDIHADAYLVKEGATFSKHTASVLYIPGQTVGDLPDCDYQDKVLMLRDLNPQAQVAATRFGDLSNWLILVNAVITVSNPMDVEIRVLLAPSVSFQSTGTQFIRKATPESLIKLAPNASATVYFQWIAVRPAFTNQIPTELNFDTEISIYAAWGGMNANAILQHRDFNGQSIGGTITPTGANVQVRMGNIVQQATGDQVAAVVPVGLSGLPPLPPESDSYTTWPKNHLPFSVWPAMTSVTYKLFTVLVPHVYQSYLSLQPGSPSYMQIGTQQGLTRFDFSHADIAAEMTNQGFSFANHPAGNFGPAVEFENIGSGSFYPGGTGLIGNSLKNSYAGALVTAKSVLDALVARYQAELYQSWSSSIWFVSLTFPYHGNTAYFHVAPKYLAAPASSVSLATIAAPPNGTVSILI